jgi:KTSC domain
MRQTGVNSSSIASIGYDSQRRELEIAFRSNGNVYRYFDVPMEEFTEFLAAESKGAYLNHVFKERSYPYVLVRKGRRKAG